MKKLKYYTAIFLCALMGVSCSLEENVYTSIYKDTYMTNTTESQTVLLGVYRNMVTEGMYRYHLSLLFSLPTDIGKIEGSSTDGFRIVGSNAYNASESEVETTWEALYTGVYDANDFIEALSEKMKSFSDDEMPEAEIQLAEAKCLRALFYFELVRWFGHVTLITDPDDSFRKSDEFEQNEPEEIYEFIESDLLSAIDVLPYASDDDVRSDNSFRFSKGAALGLLTKVYATWAGYPVHDTSKWGDAVNTAKTLVDSGKHKLNEGSNGDGYEQLWYNTCNNVWEPGESLIEVSFYSPSFTSGDPVGRIGKWNGVAASGILGIQNFAMWKVLPTFLQNWKDYEKDLRFRLTFADYKYALELTNLANYPFEDAMVQSDDMDDSTFENLRKTFLNPLTPAKWDTEKYVEESNYLINKDYSNINWYVLRYADVLLLYAEALNEYYGGPTDEAYKAVNMVRRRGFGLSVNSASDVADLEEGMSYSEFQQAVRDERSYELACEGHRRQDLVRWGIYYETIMETEQNLSEWHESGPIYYLASQYTQRNKHELLPIPQRDIDIMPKYKQNPGW